MKIFKSDDMNDLALNEYTILKDLNSEYIIKAEELLNYERIKLILHTQENFINLEEYVKVYNPKSIHINLVNSIKAIMKMILSGILYLHSSNIIHRYLKSAIDFYK